MKNPSRVVSLSIKERVVQEVNFNKLPFRVNKWAAWSPAYKDADDWLSWSIGENSIDPLSFAEGSTPSVTFLPIAMRKKLSDLCKLVLSLSHSVLEGRNDVRVVMASRFGEFELTLELLESVAGNETPSPMAFSRSVMNSSVGLFSIFSKNFNPSVCISSMEDSFKSGLFEALLQAHSYNEPILFIYVEEKILDVFRPYVQDLPVSYGMAFLLEKGEKVCNSEIESLEFLREVIRPSL